MSILDTILVSFTKNSFNKQYFAKKNSTQLLARTPKDIMDAQRQQYMLENVSTLLNWIRIERVMEAIGGRNNKGLLSREVLLRGAGCLNKEKGMKKPDSQVSGWRKHSHETLFDAFVLVDFYCCLGNAIEYGSLHNFRNILGAFITGAVDPAETIKECPPLPEGDRHRSPSDVSKPAPNITVSTEKKEPTSITPPFGGTNATTENGYRPSFASSKPATIMTANTEKKEHASATSPNKAADSANQNEHKEGGTILLGEYTFTKGEYDRIRAAATRYLPQPLETPENQMSLLKSLSSVMITFPAEFKAEIAWNELKHLSETLSEEDHKKKSLNALGQTIFAVEQSLSMQTTESFRRRVMEAQPEELLRAWAVFDYYACTIKPEYIANIRYYRDYIQHMLLQLDKNKEDVPFPIEVKGTEFHINSEALTKWMTANLLSVECTLDGVMALSEREPKICLVEDNIKTREYCLQTENDEDYTGKYFLFSIRVIKLHQGGPVTLAASIDGFISDAPENRGMTLNDVGYRMEGHFLNCGGEASVRRREITRGQDLYAKGLKYPGYTTPSNVRLIGVCPDCGKSFAFHGYAFYIGQQDVAYSDDGLNVCAINENIVDKDNWKYEKDGKTLRYYNSFCCPHCGTPYIHYKNHHDRKVFGVSGCVLLGRKHYTDAV